MDEISFHKKVVIKLYNWPSFVYCTGRSKSLCAPDDYNTIVRCTETF